jgi:DNA-binding IclR family transcriptional regulator
MKAIETEVMQVLAGDNLTAAEIGVEAMLGHQLVNQAVDGLKAEGLVAVSGTTARGEDVYVLTPKAARLGEGATA